MRIKIAALCVAALSGLATSASAQFLSNEFRLQPIEFQQKIQGVSVNFLLRGFVGVQTTPNSIDVRVRTVIDLRDAAAAATRIAGALNKELGKTCFYKLQFTIATVEIKPQLGTPAIAISGTVRDCLLGTSHTFTACSPLNIAIDNGRLAVDLTDLQFQLRYYDPLYLVVESARPYLRKKFTEKIAAFIPKGPIVDRITAQFPALRDFEPKIESPSFGVLSNDLSLQIVFSGSVRPSVADKYARTLLKKIPDNIVVLGPEVAAGF